MPRDAPAGAEAHQQTGQSEEAPGVMEHGRAV